MRTLNQYRIKGDYFEERQVRIDRFEDDWFPTNIRATPYKESELIDAPQPKWWLRLWGIKI